jgi:glutathione S-transferase
MSLVLCELADASPAGVMSYSPFCLKVHHALRLAGLPYQRQHGGRPDAWRAYNPTGQVPVLLVDGRPVRYSTEILRWLVDGGHLGGPPEAWLWEDLADSALNGFVVAARWADPQNWKRTREAYFPGMPAPLKLFIPSLLRRGVLRSLHARDIWRAGPERCWDRYKRLLDALDARATPPGTSWVDSDRWTVADVALYGQLRSLDTALTPVQAAELRARPRLSAWLDALQDAPQKGSRPVGLNRGP